MCLLIAATLTPPPPPPTQVVLAEKQQCPFTNQPLRFEQLKLLTKTNIHLHAPNIVNGSAAGGGGGAQ